MSLVGDVVTGSLKLARLPLDVINRVLGRNGLEVDAAEARVEESVGTLVGDKKLRADGARKKAATGQRARAQRLRADADRRDKAAAKAATSAASNLDELAKRERLAQLDDESSALGDRQDAQVAADEADRLGDAAAAVKAARKKTRA